MRRYIPGKGLEPRERQLAKSRFPKLPTQTPPLGKSVRVGFNPASNEIAVSIRRRIVRRVLYGK